MKKIYLLILTLCFVGILQAQKNYAEGWDGNGKTGFGSEPNNFGWQAMRDVAWQQANATEGRRYMDPGFGQYVNYTFDGEPFDQRRILWLRFQRQGDEHRYNFTGLEAGKKYILSLKYAWHNNEDQPTIAIAAFGEGDEFLVDGAFTASETRRDLLQAELDFEVPKGFTSDKFYISFSCEQARSDLMVAFTDLEVVENQQGSSISETVAEKPSFQIKNAEEGIYISSNNVDLIDNTDVYSITGQVVKNVNISQNELFVPLTSGIYIIGQQKVLVR